MNRRTLRLKIKQGISAKHFDRLLAMIKTVDVIESRKIERLKGCAVATRRTPSALSLKICWIK